MPSPTLTNLLQKPLIAAGANTAGTHMASFPGPTLLTAYWVHPAQINPVISGFIPQSTNQPLIRGLPDPPKKTHGWPWTQTAPQQSKSLCLSHSPPDHEAQDNSQSEIICERVAVFLASRNHPNKSGQMHEKMVKFFDKWFRLADKLRSATGKGNQDTGNKVKSIKFDVPLDIIKAFKLAEKQGGGKQEDNGGCLQGVQDKHNSTPLSNIENAEGSPALSESTIKEKPLDETPPCEVWQRLSMDLELGDKVTPSQEPKICKKQPIQFVAPQLSSSKPLIKYPLSFNESPKDPHGLNSLADRLPTKEEQDQSQLLAAQTQESMTTNIAWPFHKPFQLID
ncbi:hypothetical protein DFH28DRAFT_920938 [Melampsora americana]|nr:hypothetical protein DFH28DRAFT_920938 [Melampsora americana]